MLDSGQPNILPMFLSIPKYPDFVQGKLPIVFRLSLPNSTLTSSTFVVRCFVQGSKKASETVSNDTGFKKNYVGSMDYGLFSPMATVMFLS